MPVLRPPESFATDVTQIGVANHVYTASPDGTWVIEDAEAAESLRRSGRTDYVAPVVVESPSSRSTAKRVDAPAPDAATVTES